MFCKREKSGTGRLLWDLPPVGVRGLQDPPTGFAHDWPQETEHRSAGLGDQGLTTLVHLRVSFKNNSDCRNLESDGPKAPWARLRGGLPPRPRTRLSAPLAVEGGLRPCSPAPPEAPVGAPAETGTHITRQDLSLAWGTRRDSTQKGHTAG